MSKQSFEALNRLVNKSKYYSIFSFLFIK